MCVRVCNVGYVLHECAPAYPHTQKKSNSSPAPLLSYDGVHAHQAARTASLLLPFGGGAHQGYHTHKLLRRCVHASRTSHKGVSVVGEDDLLRRLQSCSTAELPEAQAIKTTKIPKKYGVSLRITAAPVIATPHITASHRAALSQMSIASLQLPDD